MRLLIIVFITSILLSFAQLPDGEKLFKQQCAACHGVDKRYTGPPFQRIRQYYSDEQLLAFIHNPAKFLVKDKRMQAVRGECGCVVMPAYPFMKPAELKAILDYVDSFPYDSTSAVYAYRNFTVAQQDSVIKVCDDLKRKFDSIMQDVR